MADYGGRGLYVASNNPLKRMLIWGQNPPGDYHPQKIF